MLPCSDLVIADDKCKKKDRVAVPCSQLEAGGSEEKLRETFSVALSSGSSHKGIMNSPDESSYKSKRAKRRPYYV